MDTTDAALALHRAGLPIRRPFSVLLRAGWPYGLLILIALGYYGSYALSGLDLGGEGGTTAVIVQRLVQGQKPLIDTFLGYNLAWFYPLVALFKWFGPDFTLVRVYFFVMSTVTALVAFRTVFRVTSTRFLAFATALILILVPGIQFRNYQSFLAVMNLAILVEAFGLPQSGPGQRLAWIAGAAFSVTGTFLFRVDAGIFFSFVLLGSAGLYLWLSADPVPMRRVAVSWAIGWLPVAFLIWHLPVNWYAQAQGFSDPFWHQYIGAIEDYESRLQQVLHLPPAPPAASPGASPAGVPVPVIRPEPATVPAAPLPVEKKPVDRSIRPLPPWTEMFRSKFGKTRLLAFLIYYPLLVALIVAATFFALIALGFRGRYEEPKQAGLLLGIVFASAYTLFPQYFLFRPDPQHLSEMMCPFLVAIACTVGLIGRLARSLSRFWRGVAIVGAAFAGFHVFCYLDYGLGVPWMGSIARKKLPEKRFTAENGVLAYLPATDLLEYETLTRAVLSHSSPSDYVICYPYAPTVNFMTNRPSYLWNLYVDNNTAPANFDDEAIHEIDTKKPALILVNDDPMNVTEGSRFSVWAAPTWRYIQTHYRHLGTAVRQEIYVAPDK